MKDLLIASVEALPCSVPLRQAVTQGLGSVTKRDTVVVKVTTAGASPVRRGLQRPRPLAIAATVNTTLRDLLVGLDGSSTTAIWDVFERRVLGQSRHLRRLHLRDERRRHGLVDLRARPSASRFTGCSAGRRGRSPPTRAASRSATPRPARSSTRRWPGRRRLRRRQVRLGDATGRDAERARALRTALART